MYETVKINYYLPTMDREGNPAFIATYEDDDWTFDVPEQQIDLTVEFEQLRAAYEEEASEIKAQRELESNIEEQFSEGDGSHYNLVQLVKDNMNDADSFEHVETKYGVNEEEGTVNLRMKFRGNNAFGQKVLNTVTATADIETGEILQANIEQQ